jgi:hypothetical protein
LAANTNVDVDVIRDATTTWTSVGKTGVDVSIFFDEEGWTPRVTFRNVSGNKSFDLESSKIVVDSGTSSVSFQATYDDAYKTLGMVEPGTWTLYAVQTVNGVDVVVSELETGNLQIKLYS